MPNGNTIDSLLKIMDWEAEKGSAKSVAVIAPLEHINCFNFDSVVRMGKLCNLVVIDELTYWKYSVSTCRSFRENIRNIYYRYLRRDCEPYIFFKKRVLSN